MSLSPSLPDPVSPSYSARPPPLRCTLGRATRRPRCIPRGTSARHRLYRASLRSCVSPALPYFFLAVSLFPPPSSSRITHTCIRPSFSLPLALSLRRTLSVSLPPFLFTCGSVFLSSLSSSPRVRRRGRRLPDRLALIPSARRRLLFFVSLSLYPPAPGIGGGCGGCQLRGSLPRLVNRDIPSSASRKARKTRKLLAYKVRVRTCQC